MHLDTEAAPARRILRRREAAAYCGLAEGTLSNMASKNVGPPRVRLGARAIGYQIRDLDIWLEQQFAHAPKADAPR